MSLEDERLLREVVAESERSGVNREFLRDDLKHHPPGSESDSWKKCSELVGRFDKELCEGFREQIDTLLVFAGLFSSVVTAFTIESYQWLYADSGDVSVQLLAEIAGALAHNGTRSEFPVPRTSGPLDSAATRINACWFLSLTLGLSAALVGILAKQWVREYDRDAGRTNRDAIGVRQMKFKGLEAWKVSQIVSSVPLLLQIALFLFFLGVIDLLWNLSILVAAPVTIVAILVLAFYSATTLLPTVQLLFWYRTPTPSTAQCPYKSPQSWLVLRCGLHLLSRWPPLLDPEMTMDEPPYVMQKAVSRAADRIRSATSWRTLDLGWTALSDSVLAKRPEYRFEALAWLRDTIFQPEMCTWMWHCLWHSMSPENYTRRASYSIQSCVPRDPDNEFPHPDIPQQSWISDERARYRILLPFAVRTSMPTLTILELVCRIFHFCNGSRCDDFRLWFAQWVSVITGRQLVEGFEVGLFRAPPRVAGPVFLSPLPEYLCRSLFYALYSISQQARPTVSHGYLIEQGLDCISYAQPGELRTRLFLATCALARRWLQSLPDISPYDKFRCIWKCMDILERCMRDVHSSESASHYEVDEAPPYRRTTIVFALLAEAIDDSWKRLQSPGHIPGPASGRCSRPDDFCRLVDIATAHMEAVNILNRLNASEGLPTAVPLDDSSNGSSVVPSRESHTTSEETDSSAGYPVSQDDLVAMEEGSTIPSGEARAASMAPEATQNDRDSGEAFYPPE